MLVAYSGNEETSNLFGLDLILQNTGVNILTLLADGLGSVRLEMVDTTVEATTTYDPYGNQLARAGTSNTVYGFSGEQEDKTTGLLYARARYYSPNTNRFLTPDSIVPDPADPQSYNRYSYVRNNPLRYIDPSGHGQCDPEGNCQNNPTIPRYPGLETPDECVLKPAKCGFPIVPYPTEACANDKFCNQAYLTYKALVEILGRTPTPAELLYMTAQAEYATYIYYGDATNMADGVGLRALGKEALARNWYEAASTDDPIYRFLSGFEPWFKGTQSPSERAQILAQRLDRDTNRAELESDIAEILDPETAEREGWDQGKMGDRPWQWINLSRPPSSTGYNGWNEAIGSLTITPNSDYFWVVTGWQDWYRHNPEQRPAPPQ